MSSYKICKYCHEYKQCCRCLAARDIKQLEKRLSESQKDVARLNWIEENSTYIGGGNGGTYSFKSPLDTECFRAAIDAAMQIHPPNQEE